MKLSPLTPEEDRIRRTVSSLARYRGLKGVDLARLTGLHTMSISSRLNGKAAFSATDIFRFAEALDVPPAVLLMEANQALRWVLDFPAVGANSTCISPTFADAA